MPDSSTNKLAQLIEHNSRMLKDAEAGNWQQVTEAEIKRQHLIDAFYSGASDIHETSVIASATQELLLVNEKLKKLAIEAREQVRGELSELGKGKTAINAYNKHSR
ncbi:MAG TPA: flagellar protein FliT [Thiotrichales bacterium]|nr:flagellar protein FliT [Thiotrichales bacterium]